MNARSDYAKEAIDAKLALLNKVLADNIEFRERLDKQNDRLGKYEDTIDSLRADNRRLTKRIDDAAKLVQGLLKKETT